MYHLMSLIVSRFMLSHNFEYLAASNLGLTFNSVIGFAVGLRR